MPGNDTLNGRAAARGMPARDPREPHRGVSPLELFFDLCFVVAIAQATSQLADAASAGQLAGAVTGYLTVFFAVWWAWMNFTWFASAFDNDDVAFRIATFVQITGALTLAAGTSSAFTRGDFTIVFLGYAVMRVGLVGLWLRAAYWNPGHRRAALRYATGLVVAMLGWSTMLTVDDWPMWAWCAMALVELAIPPWAESGRATPWNPHHIARRYGRFLIIVLGQSVLVVTESLRTALERDAGAALVAVIGGGLLLVFAMWWLYFAAAPARFLDSNRRAFAWGYGHYFIFGAAAAVGAGIAVNLDRAVGGAVATGTAAAATLTVPAAVYLLALWVLHLRPQRWRLADSLSLSVAFAVVVAATWSPWPLAIAGAATAGAAIGKSLP